MKNLFTFSLLCIGFFGFGQEITGVWYNTDKSGKVEIFDCGGYLCGKIVWLADPNDENGTPKTDKNNPNEEMKSKPVLGLQVMKGFEKGDKENFWEDGTIYDPKNGKTYKCQMTLKGDVLDVRGYIGFSMLGRTETWSRAK